MTNGLFMQVSTTGSTNLPTGRDSLMVARTVNSQGLTDNGTLSIYVRNPNSATPGAPTATDRWTIDVNFAFFSDAGFTTPVTTKLLLTSLDIDYAQRYYTQNSDFTSNSTYFGVNGTDLISAEPITGYTGYTTIADADSVINDPEHGVSSIGSGTSFDVRLSHTSIALFMFEFRDPSQIIPEPSSSLMMVGGLSVLGLMRRRQRHA